MRGRYHNDDSEPDALRPRSVVSAVTALASCLLSFAASGGPIDDLKPGEWYEFPDSKIQGVLPDPLPRGNPQAITKSWNGGAFDPIRNRLMVSGGGHADYAGNEVYAFDVATGRWSRLVDPSESPLSVHNYDQVEFLPQQDRYFVAGGSRWRDGRASKETWLFDPDDNTWLQGENIPGKLMNVYEFNMTTAYDPVSDQVILAGYSSSASYSGKTGTWSHHKNRVNRKLGLTGALDPVRRRFVTIGRGHAFVYTADHHGRLGGQSPLDARGAIEIQNVDAPGFDYDPVSGKLIAWGVGANVYTLDLGTPVWTRLPPTNNVTPGDPYERTYHGTFGRWRYMPDYDAFILVTAIDRNVFAYRLAETGGSTEPLQPAKTAATARPKDGGPPNSAGGMQQPVPWTPAVIPPPPPGRYDAEKDWQARATGPGVVRAINFGTRSEWLDHVWDRNNCDPRYAPGCRTNAWDQHVRVSGGGSVRFDILSNSHEGAAGNLAINFSEDLSVQFGANEEFWIQWRQRFDRFAIEHDYANKSGKGEWKQVIIAQGDTKSVRAQACSENQIVVVNAGNRDYPSTYIECGRYDPFDYKVGTVRGSGAFTRQNQQRNEGGSYSCLHSPKKGDRSGCQFYKPDQWMTFMVHVTLGAEGRAPSSVSKKAARDGFVNSSYELYVAEQGRPLKLIHRQDDLVIPRGQRWNADEGVDPDRRGDPGYRGGWGPADAHPEARYGKLWLTPFNTRKDRAEAHPPASIWYDEIIISRDPIASPGGDAVSDADR